MSRQPPLKKHLANWNTVATLLSSDIYTSQDIERLLAIEAAGAHRSPIMKRLIGRLLTLQRRKLYEKYGVK